MGAGSKMPLCVVVIFERRLTSSADKVSDANYRWTLFVNIDGALLKSTEKVCSTENRQDLPCLATSVVAKKGDTVNSNDVLVVIQ